MLISLFSYPVMSAVPESKFSADQEDRDRSNHSPAAKFTAVNSSVTSSSPTASLVEGAVPREHYQHPEAYQVRETAASGTARENGEHHQRGLLRLSQDGHTRCSPVQSNKFHSSENDLKRKRSLDLLLVRPPDDALAIFSTKQRVDTLDSGIGRDSPETWFQQSPWKDYESTKQARLSISLVIARRRC